MHQTIDKTDHPAQSSDAARLAAVIRANPDLIIVPRGPSYGHMDATITDAMLQAGMRYRTQVWPRGQHTFATCPRSTWLRPAFSRR
jgi:hypothetical protein